MVFHGACDGPGNDVTKDFKSSCERSLGAALQETKAKLARRVLGLIRSHADLTRRLELLLSLPGIGPIVAASLIVRMPELGAMRRGQAASLIGLAPFDRDSGQFKGQRHIGGGRARPRRMLYMAALAAKRFDPDFKAFAQRLKDDGKKPKVVLVAVMRKLVEAANLVVRYLPGPYSGWGEVRGSFCFLVSEASQGINHGSSTNSPEHGCSLSLRFATRGGRGILKRSRPLSPALAGANLFRRPLTEHSRWPTSAKWRPANWTCSGPTLGSG